MYHSGKNKKIKQCLYPGCESTNIIRAHVFQNNGVLSELAVNNKVFMPKGRGLRNQFTINEFSRSQATTFTGFCGKHDKVLFQPIEDEDWQLSAESVFLFTYRTFASQMHAKQEEARGTKWWAKKVLDNEKTFETNVMGQAVADFVRDKRMFDEFVTNRRKIPLKYMSWVIRQPINFAASGFISPYFDLNGEPIQGCRESINRHLYITIVPRSGRAVAILAWMRVDDRKFRSYLNQLRRLDREQRKRWLSNICMKMSDNLVLSPRLKNSLTSHQEQLIVFEYYESQLRMLMSEKREGKNLELQDFGLNLFDF